MFIVLILLLTVLSVALRLATMSVNATRKVSSRYELIKDKRDEKAPSKTKKAGRAVKDGALKVASSAVSGLQVVVSMLRNILLGVSPMVLIVELLIFFILVAVSSGISTLFN